MTGGLGYWPRRLDMVVAAMAILPSAMWGYAALQTHDVWTRSGDVVAMVSWLFTVYMLRVSLRITYLGPDQAPRWMRRPERVFCPFCGRVDKRHCCTAGHQVGSVVRQAWDDDEA